MAWTLHHGDCIPFMNAAEPASIDCAIFSPPFPALYAYTDQAEDIGNVSSFGAESKIHLSFLFRGLARVVKPGRVIVVHCSQIVNMKRSGFDGLTDFRGTLIRIGQRCGLIYEYDWMVRKNPQAQAIRNRSRELQFAGLESDRANSRGTLNDYLIKFVVPGDNAVAIDSRGQVNREQWIQWAEGCWDDVIETDTLNVAQGRSEKDTKHICPLQLEVIRRLVLMYSNPGEIVFSPFAGIGSEGYVALGGKSPKTGRRVTDPRSFIGCEIKPEYIAAAESNLRKAEAYREDSMSLFAEVVA